MSEDDSIKFEIDESSLGNSLSKVRGLMFEINSVRNLAQDTIRMSQDPSLSNAFWLGLQMKQTAKRVGMMEGTINDLKTGVKEMWAGYAGLLGAAAVPVAIGAAAALVIGGVLSYNQQQEEAFKQWQTRQGEVAKQQGLSP